MTRKFFGLCVIVFALTFTLLPGCRIQISVPEGGRVVSQSGAYSCESGDTCIIDVVDVFFDETFEGIPAPGYTFANWRKGTRVFCGGRKKPCHLFTTTFPGTPLIDILESDQQFYLFPVFAKPNHWFQVGTDMRGIGHVELFGGSVSISGDGRRVASGAALSDRNGNNSGHAGVYEWSGTTWLQLGEDIGGEFSGDISGSSVSLSADGKRVAIGAPGNDTGGSSSGHVRVYEWSGEEWLQIGADIDGEAAGAGSGFVSLSSDGKRLAIGAPYSYSSGNELGYVKVYALSGNAWMQLGDKLNWEALGDNHSAPVSLSAKGNRLAIGSVGSGPTIGYVKVYEWSGTAWLQLGVNIDGEAAGSKLGWSVSLSGQGDHVAIGAPSYSSISIGRVKVYKWSDNAWLQIGEDIEEKVAHEFFGNSVSLSANGRELAIGASSYDGGYGRFSNNGITRIYSYFPSADTWRQRGVSIEGEDYGENFGNSVSLSADGKRVAVGAPNNDRNSLSSGAMRVYELQPTTKPPQP
jgi:hypothetical protein